MAVADYFLQPLGLVALAAIIPLIILYFLKPKPKRVRLPTMRFLFGDEAEDDRPTIIRALQRDWLFLVQLLVLILLALSVASPYVGVAEEQVVDERVLVVDASASMAAEAGGTTRFAQTVQQAKNEVSGTTSIVVSGGSSGVALRQGPAPQAQRTLDTLSVSHADGSLADAIGRAAAIAGEDAIVVVVSDFAADSDWSAAVATARAQGLRVDLRQVDNQVENVGIVDVSFQTGTVTATVTNFADRRVTRSVSLGGQSEELELRPGDSASVQLPIPANGGELRLSPGDAFPVDDRVPIASPADPTVDVLVLTNDENRFLTTALSLIDDVSLSVARPPTTITREYDIIVFSNVDSNNVLPGNIETSREVLRNGGGVVIQAQSDIRAINYGGLLPVQPRGVVNGTSVDVADDPLTDGITFGAPERFVEADLTDGRALVTAADGTPLIATAQQGGGTVLYYGYLEAASSFKYNYKYPVFWQRAIYTLAGRQPIAAYNRRTGTTHGVGENRTVQGPAGELSGPTVALDHVGYYTVGDQRYGAALLDRTESNLTAPDVATGNQAGPDGSRLEQRTVPLDLSPAVIALVLLTALLELALLRRRGDL